MKKLEPGFVDELIVPPGQYVTSYSNTMFGDKSSSRMPTLHILRSTEKNPLRICNVEMYITVSPKNFDRMPADIYADQTEFDCAQFSLVGPEIDLRSPSRLTLYTFEDALQLDNKPNKDPIRMAYVPIWPGPVESEGRGLKQAFITPRTEIPQTVFFYLSHVNHRVIIEPKIGQPKHESLNGKIEISYEKAREFVSGTLISLLEERFKEPFSWE